jgi:hypothetical protein
MKGAEPRIVAVSTASTPRSRRCRFRRPRPEPDRLGAIWNVAVIVASAGAISGRGHGDAWSVASSDEALRRVCGGDGSPALLGVVSRWLRSGPFAITPTALCGQRSVEGRNRGALSHIKQSHAPKDVPPAGRRGDCVRDHTDQRQARPASGVVGRTRSWMAVHTTARSYEPICPIGVGWFPGIVKAGIASGANSSSAPSESRMPALM